MADRDSFILGVLAGILLGGEDDWSALDFNIWRWYSWFLFLAQLSALSLTPPPTLHAVTDPAYFHERKW
jgi:hypothetical protein